MSNKMKKNQKGRRPKWKTTTTENDQNERQQKWKTTKIKDNQNGPNWKTPEEDLNFLKLNQRFELK